jgi:electron transport complex protein RnfC
MLTPPKLSYDLIEPNPEGAESVPVPPNLVLLLAEPIDGARNMILKKGDAVEKGQKNKSVRGQYGLCDFSGGRKH